MVSKLCYVCNSNIRVSWLAGDISGKFLENLAILNHTFNFLVPWGKYW